MKQRVIVQAGGKGTRLEHYCWNKPKCLVPVDGKPLLYHLFDAFEGAEFQVIAQYKADVLKRYVEAFPPQVKLGFTIPPGGGTCSGIFDALEAIPDDEPFWLVWSDLYFGEVLKAPPGAKPVVYLSRRFPCRWSAIEESNGQQSLVEVRSSEAGVMGLFWFPKKSIFRNLPESGEFVRWLSEALADFDVLYCDEVQELGTLNALQNHWDSKATTRFFNRVTVQGDRVFKEAMIDDYAPMIEREINWYEKVAELGFKNTPELLDTSPLTLARIEGNHPYRLNWGAKGRQEILHNIFEALENLHRLDQTPPVQEDIRSVYLDKTLVRIQKAGQLVPELREWPALKVNGIVVPNVLHSKHENDLSALVQKLACDAFTIIHGDPTFSNIIVDAEQKPWFIDPRGSFAKESIYGDPSYDWTKVYYSVVGNYDNFNRRQFVLIQDGRNVEIDIREGGWSHLRDVFRERFSPAIYRNIRILHGLVWLSLSGWVDDDYDSILAAFYNGLYYLRDALET